MSFTKEEILGFLYFLCVIMCLIDTVCGGMFVKYILAFLVATVVTDVFWIEDKRK